MAKRSEPGLGEGAGGGGVGRRGEGEGRARAGREGGGRGGERGKRAGEGTPANLHRVRRNGAGGTWRGRKLTYSPHCTVGGISIFLPFGTTKGLNIRFFVFGPPGHFFCGA